MLTRLVENALVSLFNRTRRGPPAPAPLPEPADPEIPADSVILGRTFGTDDAPSVPVALSPDERRRHMYVLGATGTGKTNFLLRLIEADIAAGRSFCVIDLRGDLVDRIMLRLAQGGNPDAFRERLLLVDLRDEDHVVGFNPLTGAGDMHSRAFHMLEVFKQQSGSWGVQLEETLRNCLIALTEAGWSILEIEPLLSNATFRAEVLARVTDSYVRSFFQRYGQLTEAKQTDWRLPVLNKVTPLLAIPQLRLMFGQRESFSFAEILDSAPGKVILISLAVDRLHQAAYLVGGLLVSSFQGAIMARASRPEAERIPAFLYLDEFETMATDNFEAIVAEGRRFGLGLCLSHQNGHQIPTGLRHVLRNNVHTQLYFQTGAIDAADLASEITSGESRDAVRTTLMTQGVGEAYMVRRGHPDARIRIDHCPDPRAPANALNALRAASRTAYARPRREIERELTERENRGGEAPGEPTPPTYVIRHEKTQRFRPRSGQ